MCEYVGQGLKYEFRSKQQVGKVGILITFILSM